MEPVTLRDGSTTNDPRLDRLVEFDERSKDHPVSEVLPDAPLKSKTWFCRPRLDQGRQGACVSFAWTHELVASPVTVRLQDATQYAKDNYWEMQKNDRWEGGSYPGATPFYEGTSNLSGAQITHKNGYIESYKWAFDIDEVLASLSHIGPVVLSSAWYGSMFNTRPSGLIEVDFSSAPEGGHCYTSRGVNLKPKLNGESSKIGTLIRVRNSWGEDWGARGDCFFKVEDLERLLKESGDACIPIQRKK